MAKIDLSFEERVLLYQALRDLTDRYEEYAGMANDKQSFDYWFKSATEGRALLKRIESLND